MLTPRTAIHRSNLRRLRLLGAALAIAAVGIAGSLSPVAARANGTPSTLYVDANAASPGPNCTAQAPCAMIGAAITAAASGDTIMVADGTYAEGLVIGKSLTIVGPNADVSPNQSGTTSANAARAAEAVLRPTANTVAIRSGAAGLTVTVKGMTLDLSANEAGKTNANGRFFYNNHAGSWNFVRNILRGYNGGATYAALWNTSRSPTSLSFVDNRIADNAWWGNGLMDDGPGVTELLIEGNVWLDNYGWAMNLNNVHGTITGNRIVEEPGSSDQWGILLASPDNDLSVVGNTLRGGLYNGIALYSGGEALFGGELAVSNNLFDGVQRGIRAGNLTQNVNLSGVSFSANSVVGVAVLNNQTGKTLDAEGNWWGQVDGPDQGQLTGTGTVSARRWIRSYTDDPAKAGQPGFWPIAQTEVALVAAGVANTIGGEALGSPTLAPAGTPRSGTPTATVSVVGNPASAISTPFRSGSTIIDIQASDTLGPYTVCIKGQSPERLWHFVDGSWVDVTNAPPNDYVGSRVCGTTDTLSPFTAAPLKTAPESGTPPSLTGTAVVGQTLSTTDGTWTGDPVSAFARAWLRCPAATSTAADCTPIAGASGAAYTLVADDLNAFIRSSITASNAGGSRSAVSEAIGPVSAAGTAEAAAAPVRTRIRAAILTPTRAAAGTDFAVRITVSSRAVRSATRGTPSTTTRLRTCLTLPRQLRLVATRGARITAQRACWSRARLGAGTRVTYVARLTGAEPTTRATSAALLRVAVSGTGPDGTAIASSARATVRITPAVQPQPDPVTG